MDRQHAKRTRYRGTLNDWDVIDPASAVRLRLRVAFIHSSEEHTSVADGRERALTKAERRTGQDPQRPRRPLLQDPQIKQVDTKLATILHPKISPLLKSPGTGVDDRGRPTIAFTRDHHAITTTDGIYALATNLPGANLRAVHVLRRYKQQQIVERRNRDARSTLKVRPVFLHNDDRIDALVSIVGLALLSTASSKPTYAAPLAGPPPTCPDCSPNDAPPAPPHAPPSPPSTAATYTHAGLVLDRQHRPTHHPRPTRHPTPMARTPRP